MSYFDISGATFDENLRKLETSDPAHADVFNALLGQLINNDVALKEAVTKFAASKNEQALFLLNLHKDGKQLLSPIEIIEYLKWREVFYKNNGPINLLITETNNGFVLSKPQKNENLVQQYLYEKYGENAIYEDRLYYELFRQYVLVLYEHKEIESEINGCYEVIKFLAHLFRDEIKCFVERTEKALLIAKTKKFNLVGTLRNVQKEYAIVFTATEQIPSEKLLPVVFEKQKVHTLLQVITYWVMTLFVYIKLFESIVTVEGEDFLNSREEKECYKLVRESTKFIYDRLEEFSKYNCKTASDELNRHMRNMFKNMRSSLKEEVGSIKKDFL